MDIPLIIHDLDRLDRARSLYRELEGQGIREYKIMPAVKRRQTPVANISEAHKRCIQYAMDEGLSRIVIMEDDIHFVAPDAYKRFIEGVEYLPEDWELYFGGVYDGDIEMINERIGVSKNISGLHCYMVNSSYYGTLLSAPGNVNLDKWMTGERQGNTKAHVLYPMVALQHDGYSDNVQRETDYNRTIRDRFKVWNGKK